MKIVRPMTISDDSLVACNVPETDATAWNSGSTYAAGARVRVVAANVHQVFQSVQNGNTNHDPLSDDGTWWLLVGATNRWRLFDVRAQSQTTNPDSITFTIQTDGRQDSVVLLNLTAASVRVRQTDTLSGNVVYDKTFSMVDLTGKTTFYAWYFDPLTRRSDLVLTDLLPYSDATITVEIFNTGSTAKCGECVIGQSRYIGRTQYGASVGIMDYSTKEADQFGDFDIVERAYADTASLRVMIKSNVTDFVKDLLAKYRAKPIVYIGSDLYTSTAVFGFFRDFTIEIAYLEDSLVSIEVEGLV